MGAKCAAQEQELTFPELDAGAEVTPTSCKDGTGYHEPGTEAEGRE
jgi:hypothetical protein